MSFPRYTLVIALVTAFASGCMTLDTRNNTEYDGPRVYSGARTSALMFASGFYAFDLGGMMFGLVDLPFSFVADTVLLPLTIPEESERQRGIEARLQVRTERPSVIEARAGEDPEATARRFFERCVDHLHRWKPELTDCYSIDARVETSTSESVREWRGAEYKTEIRRRLAALRHAGEYVDIREARFRPLDDGTVEITALRATAAAATTSAFRWLVGPGPDGGWRVLEESSAGWDEAD